MFTRERSASVIHEDRTARKARFAHSPAVSVGAQATGHKRLGRIRLGRWRSPQSRLARWPSALSLLVGWRSAAPESVGSKSTSSLFDTFALPSNCRHRRIDTPRANYAAHAHCNLCLTCASTRAPKQQPSAAVWAPVMRVVLPLAALGEEYGGKRRLPVALAPLGRRTRQSRRTRPSGGRLPPH